MTRLIISSLAGLLVLAPAAQAHPHVWVDASARILFGGAGAIEAIEHSWTFDEAFSAYLMQGLDANGDGVFSRDETAELAELNVTSLQEFFYFTSIAGAMDTDRIGDLFSEDFDAPTNYYLDHDGVRTTLTFTLPLQAPVTAAAHDLVVVDIFDPEYFVAFSLAERDPIELVGAPTGCALTLDEPPELDDSYASILALIPADGIVPEELLQVTTQLANRARVRCG
ncbi:MAG: DUF1007 family protein [Devosiaceae bacterium]|nr:DUF1007 family protein [Devosiaceae bacterium MH13]